MKRLNSRSERTLFNLLLHLQHKPQQESGYIIVVVMGMVLALSTVLITAALTSKVDTNNSRASGNSAAGFYAAEAGLNLRAKAIRDTFVGYNVPGHSGVDLSPADSAACRDTTGTPPVLNTANDGSGDFACDNSKTFKGQPVSTFVQNSNKLDSTGKPIPTPITIDSGDFAGLNAQEYRYDVTSIAFDQENQPTASLQMRFKSRLVPLFQFAAFYENDLDFYRPAPMTINGPIHTNSNLYLNAGGNLTLNGQLTSAGRMYRGPKNPSETCNANSNGFSGTVKIKHFTSTSLLDMNCYGSPRAEITMDSSNSSKINVGGTYVNNWGGQIRPSIARLTVPSSSFIDAKLPDSNNAYDYWNKADLRIALRLTDDTAESPVSIEVINADAGKTTNTAATATLNGSTCLPTSTTLAGTSYTTNSNSITVANGSSFNNGDALRIVGSGFEDSDENVITNKTVTNTLPLRRPLGKQGISSVTGVTVQKAIVWSSKTFFNYREKTLEPTTSTKTLAQKGRLIRMLNVDVQGLMNCAGGSLMGGKSLNDTTDGGLVWYFTVLGPKSTVDVTKASPDSPNSYGIRLYNGATLGAGSTAIQGLTVASDQALYIRGDYNSNTKKPAAILADSINILSNSSPLDDSTTCTGYDATYNAGDCTSTTGLSSRLTSNTTINAAFLSGVDVTGTVGGEDSGGLNNYPRLHEGWSGSTLTYRGSMVSLGRARRVNGPFGAVGTTYNIYSAPDRNWDYDIDFNNAANLPPLTPRFVYLRQERFSRDFNRRASLPSPYSLASLFPLNVASILPTFPTTSFRF
jgi:hypothetical protein